MPQAIDLKVNGAARRVETDPERTLLSVLRDDLDLTGAKYGCGEGQCGACTVLLDGRPVKACLFRVKAAQGKAVTTIEGLARDGRLHPLQQSFIDCGAMQCGYCVPGMILSAAALLAATPKPSDAEIVGALEGNLCRCCAYPRILAAVRQAGGRP